MPSLIKKSMKEKIAFNITDKLQNLSTRKIESIAKTATISVHFRYEGEDVNEGVDLARGSMLYNINTIPTFWARARRVLYGC